MQSFIKLLIILGAAVLIYRFLDTGSAGFSSSGLKLPESQSSAVAEARAEGKKLVILITGSKWCGPCKMLERDVLSSPEWKAFASSEIRFDVYDYPSPSDFPTSAHRDLTGVKGFRGFPTILVADSKGTVTGMKAGFGGGGPSELISWIRSH